MTASSLSDSEYHQQTTSLLAAIEAQIDQWLEQDVVDIDTHRTGDCWNCRCPMAARLCSIRSHPCMKSGWRRGQVVTTSATMRAGGWTRAMGRSSLPACLTT
jgi:CyaY protein